MQLLNIRIKNFKGLNDANLNPGTFSCLVGENNSGKSSVLQSITTALNRIPSLSKTHFYNPDLPVEFIWKLSDIEKQDFDRLADEHRSKIEPLVINGSIEFCSRYSADSGKLELKVLKKKIKDPNLSDERISEQLKSKKGTAISGALENILSNENIEIPTITTQGEAKDFLRNYIEKLPIERFIFEEGPLPSGISSSLADFLPEPIYIPAVKNLHDDLKTTQSTNFGKLLSLLLEDLQPDLHTFNESFIKLNTLLNRPGGDEGTDSRHEKIKNLEKSIEKNLSANFPKLKVELSIPPPELKSVLSSAQLLVDDGAKDLIDNKGDGVKRSLTFSILKTYVDELEQRAKNKDANSKHRPIILLFEEPELYLHPRAQKILFNALSIISREQQVIVTTHSPTFFAPNVTASFIRVSKEPHEPKPVGKLYPVEFKLNEELADVFKLAKFENADAAFFSKRIVLFEGDSDEFFIKHASLTLNDKWNFDFLNIALIPVNGKGNFKKYKEFFKNFNIDVIIIADLDAILDSFHCLDASPAIPEIREKFIKQLDLHIEQNPQLKLSVASRSVAKQLKTSSWQERYNRLKSECEQLEEGQPIRKEFKEALHSLFTWEQNHHRLNALFNCDAAKGMMDDLRKKLYQEKIFILRKGAIEEYYPPTIGANISKPERALKAIELTNTKSSLQQNTIYESKGEKCCEFEEILVNIFAGIE